MAEHAVVAKPAAVTAKQPRKGLSRAPASESAHEREADRAADAIVNGPRAVGNAPKRLNLAADGSATMAGRAIDAAPRALMEARFGYDFRQVRIHDDDAAARLADAHDALAYTRGANIVFARGAYAPHSRAGAHLLAHELTHVVQQAHHPQLAGTIQRQPKPKVKPAPAPVWYQEAIDHVALSKQRSAQQRKELGIDFGDTFLPRKEALLRLCESVDQKQWDVVPTNLDKLLKEGIGLIPTDLISRDLLTELSARMFEQGLEADAERLRQAYAANEKASNPPFHDDPYAARRKIEYFTRLVKGASADAKHDTPDALKAALHRYTRVYTLLRDEYAKIDWEALKWERQSGSFPMVLRPYMSHTEYYEAVRGQIEEWLRGISTLVQNAMDAARRDLESKTPTGDGAALLKTLHTSFNGELKEELSPEDRAKREALTESFPVTKTTMGKGKGTISDAFAQGKEAKARAVKVTTYDPDQDYAPELRATLVSMWRARMNQIETLGRIYGVVSVLAKEKTPAEQKAAEEKALDTAQTIRNTSSGRLRLDSDDDWRDFLLQRYRDLTNPKAPPAPAPTASPTTAPPAAARKPLTPAEALHEIVDLLFQYLRAFTVHARYTNLYDVGEQSYINRPFPRALTGQLVHDCGVYALRVAYVLSLVRKELGLRFRFVVLPVHVSLVITGEKLPAFIVENDHFTEISADDLEERRKTWQQFKDPTTNQPPSGKADEEQFIGELGASEFIRGPLDMPFKVSDVPPPVKDAKAEQKRLWEYYQKTSTQELFGPSSKKKGDPNYLFHTNYLQLTEKFREAYNEAFVPFWNKAAPDAWDTFDAKVKGTTGKPGAVARTKVKVDDLMTPVGEYKFDFEQARQEVKARYDALIDEEKRISRRLRDDPKLSKAGVRISVGARAMGKWRYYWESHLDAIDTFENDLINKPSDAEETVDAIQKALNPPFVPRDDKRVEPLP